MIQSNELRQGNKIMFLNEVVTFENISQFRDDGVFWINVDEKYFSGKSIHFKPIPLTEEWLIRFGFFKHNNAYVLEKPTENIMDFKFSIWDDFTYNSSEFPIEIKHVHTLQNLYWVLCGKELILKQ